MSPGRLGSAVRCSQGGRRPADDLGECAGSLSCGPPLGRGLAGAELFCSLFGRAGTGYLALLVRRCTSYARRWTFPPVPRARFRGRGSLAGPSCLQRRIPGRSRSSRHAFRGHIAGAACSGVIGGSRPGVQRDFGSATQLMFGVLSGPERTGAGRHALPRVPERGGTAAVRRRGNGRTWHPSRCGGSTGNVPAIGRWQGQQGSNPRPTVLETVALPAELYPYPADLAGVPPICRQALAEPPPVVALSGAAGGGVQADSSGESKKSASFAASRRAAGARRKTGQRFSSWVTSRTAPLAAEVVSAA